MLSCLTFSIETVADAARFLDVYAVESRRAPEERITRVKRLGRMRRLLALLGDPQNQLKVIHVAGTTGKGSTCTYIEALLRVHGHTTGLSLSPHAVDIRERFQVNGAYPPDDLLVLILRRIMTVVRRMESESYGVPGYIEILMATAYAIFAEARVRYAVIETGVGGRLDPSNTVMRADKLCVFTKLGKDHVEVLGERLEDIAYQKVGIIQSGNDVVIGLQEEYSQAAFVEHAMQAGAERIICVDAAAPARLSGIATPYLRENAALAITACEQMAARDGWILDRQRVDAALQVVAIPLRCELIHWEGRTIILDAAHNQQKMQGFVEALKARFPRHSLAALIALNPGTPVQETLSPLFSQVARIACTDFVVGTGAYRFRFMDPHLLAQQIAAMTASSIATPPEVVIDIEATLRWLEEAPESLVVCTGSFHFVAALRALLLG